MSTQPVTVQIATDFLKNVEGCRLQAYQDGGGVWTIGYGHTGSEVHEGLVRTQDQADEALKEDVTNAYLSVKKLIGTESSDKQTASFISFVFNLGAASFMQSTLLVKFRQKDYIGTSKEFIRWDHIQKTTSESKGLLLRRAREMVLFLEGS